MACYVASQPARTRWGAARARPALQPAPGPPDGFAEIRDVTKLTGPFGQRCTQIAAALRTILDTKRTRLHK